MALNPKDVMLENRLGILKLRGRVQTPPGLSQTSLRLGRANCGRQIMGLAISALLQRRHRVLQLQASRCEDRNLSAANTCPRLSSVCDADTRGSSPWRQQLGPSASSMQRFHRCQHNLTFSRNTMLALPFPVAGCASVGAFSEPQGTESFHQAVK